MLVMKITRNELLPQRFFYSELIFKFREYQVTVHEEASHAPRGLSQV